MIVLVFILVSCKNPNKQLVKKTSFTELDYTFHYAFGASTYSVKLTNSDTVYVKNILFSDHDTTYYGVLNGGTKLKLDTLMSRLDIKTLDSTYEGGDNDGDELYLYYEKDSLKKLIYIHGFGVPKKLNELREFLKSIKSMIILTPTTKKIKFVTYETFFRKKVRNGR